MKPLIVKRTVNAPIENVWRVWDSFGDIHRFHPGLENSYLIEKSEPTGKGARRRCDFTGGKNYILEELVGYDPQGKMVVKIYDGNIPLKEAYVTFTFRRVSAQATEISASAEFTPKFGPLGALLRPLMRMQLGKGLEDLLRGNAEYMEAVPA
jgi:uncharacterized protein YndB with AHSA1/START domain